jgi:hypothetical protein
MQQLPIIQIPAWCKGFKCQKNSARLSKTQQDALTKLEMPQNTLTGTAKSA